MRLRVKGWPGYVHQQKNGEQLFIIERQVTVDGERHRFHLSTGCHSMKPALEQLARFEADPFEYTRAGRDLRGALLFTPALVEKLYDAQLARNLTPKYARETSTWLKKWGKNLRGVDLRRLSLSRDIVPILDAASPGARRPMMAALKTFFGWLRTERHEISSNEDVTRDLRLEQSSAAKNTADVAHDIRHVRKVSRLLRGVYRDALLFQWATSCHVTELERFVRDPRSQIDVFEKPQRLADGTKVLAQVVFWHKTKDWHRVGLVRKEHVEAALRLRRRGRLPSRTDLNTTIYAACEKAKVPRMSFVMRHTTLTRAAELGVSEDRRMQHARHKDARTTRRYVDVKLPLAALPVEEI